MTSTDWRTADREAIARMRQIANEEVPYPTPLARALVNYLLPQQGLPTQRPTFTDLARRLDLPLTTLVSDLHRAGIARPKHVADAVLLARLASLRQFPAAQVATHLGFSTPGNVARLVHTSRGVSISMFRKYTTLDQMLDEWRDLLQLHRAALSVHPKEVSMST